MSDRTKSRIVGAISAFLGLAEAASEWQSAHTRLCFSAKLSLISPVVVALGIWLVVEGPELPARKLSLLGWLFLILGLVAGVLFKHFLQTGRLAFLG